MEHQEGLHRPESARPGLRAPPQRVMQRPGSARGSATAAKLAPRANWNDFVDRQQVSRVVKKGVKDKAITLGLPATQCPRRGASSKAGSLQWYRLRWSSLEGGRQG